MKKTYVDITQLYNWQGKLTGIQRVMYELSYRFIDDDRFDPTFVIWSTNTASFYEVNFSEWITNRQAGPGAQAAVRQDSKTKKLAKRVYHHVPLSRTMYNTYSSINARMIQRVAPEKVIEIEPGAVLFMPHGGVWESETYISHILRLQQQSHVKLAPILFDLTPVVTPQFVVEPLRIVFENYMKQVLPSSDLVLAISKHTASDARTWLKASAPGNEVNIEVFRLGDEVGSNVSKPTVELPKDYILCVGTVEARKNHTGLYYAYKQLVAEKKPLPKIVVVGRQGWMASEIYQIIATDPETRDNFIFLHNIADDELAWLYKHAQFSIYPSFYEGWGLPVAESLLRGTPCLASNTSSVPEIAGSLIDYFSPYSPDEIKQKIDFYNTNPQALKDLRAKVEKGYKATSWEMSYSQIAEKLHSLL